MQTEKTGDGSMSLLLTVNLLLSNIYYHLFFCLSRKYYDMKKLKAPSPRELNLFLLFIRRQRTNISAYLGSATYMEAYESKIPEGFMEKKPEMGGVSAVRIKL